MNIINIPNDTAQKVIIECEDLIDIDESMSKIEKVIDKENLTTEQKVINPFFERNGYKNSDYEYIFKTKVFYLTNIHTKKVEKFQLYIRSQSFDIKEARINIMKGIDIEPHILSYYTTKPFLLLYSLNYIGNNSLILNDEDLMKDKKCKNLIEVLLKNLQSEYNIEILHRIVKRTL